MTEIIDSQFGGSVLYSPINGFNNLNTGNTSLFTPKLSSIGFDGAIPSKKDTKNVELLKRGDYVLLQTSGSSLILGTDYTDANSSIYLITSIFLEEPTDSETTIKVVYNQQEIDVVLTNGDTAYYMTDDWNNRELGTYGWQLTSAGNAIFTNVAVRGEINATSGTFAGYVSAGNLKLGTDVNSANDGIYIDTNNYWYDTGNFSIGNGTSGVTWNGTTLAVTGTITATLGSIGGFTIGSTSLTAGSGLNSVGLDTTGYPFYAGNATPASAPFRVTTTGALTATNATVTGTVNATAGYFGSSTDGWTVNSTSISNSSTKNLLSSYDPSFEGAWSSYWTSSTTGNATKSSSTANVYDGKYSASIFHYASGSDTSTYYLENSQTMVLPSTISGSYTLSLYLRTNASRTITVTVTPYIGASPQTSLTPWSISSTTTLTRYSNAFTFPAGTTGLRIKVSTASISVSGYVTILEMDAMQLESGSSATAYGVSSSISIDAYSSNKFNISYNNTTKYNINASGDIIASTLQLQSSSDLTLYSTGHGLQIGADNSQNLRIDTNEIQSVDGSGSTPSAATLNLNKEGGQINLGSATSTPVTRVFGDLRIGASPGNTYKLELDGSALISQNLRITGNISTVTNITATADVGAVTGTFTGIVSTTNEFQAGNGSVTDPSYTFGSDGDTGLYSSSANTLGIASGGTVAATFGSNINLEKILNVNNTSGFFASSGFYSGTLSLSTTTVSSDIYAADVSSSASERAVYIRGNDGTNPYRIGTLSSTRRVKQQISNAKEEILSSRFLELEPVKFKYNNAVAELGDAAAFYYGFIAEDAQELGLEFLYGTDEFGVADYFAHEKMPVYLFTVVKEQNRRIKELEERLAILEK